MFVLVKSHNQIISVSTTVNLFDFRLGLDLLRIASPSLPI